MSILNAMLVQKTLKLLLVELRISPRSRNRSDICYTFDPKCPQNIEKLFRGTR